MPHTVVISCNMRLNLDYLIQCLWEHLNLIKVFTKKRGQKPDLVDGIILRNGATVEAVAHSIHRSIVDSFKYALVWVMIHF
jgi:ribosome-interacting GTPase 1